MNHQKAADPGNSGSDTFHSVYQICPEECIGCGTCFLHCYHDAIRQMDDCYQIDQTRCVECGRCIAFCPAGAIHKGS